MKLNNKTEPTISSITVETNGNRKTITITNESSTTPLWVCMLHGCDARNCINEHGHTKLEPGKTIRLRDI